VGNMATETIVSFLDLNTNTLKLNMSELNKALNLSNEIFSTDDNR
jgi:hypothetical protein